MTCAMRLILFSYFFCQQNYVLRISDWMQDYKDSYNRKHKQSHQFKIDELENI